MRRLTSLFPSEFLEEHAEELGVVERDRKLQIPAFVWAFVFGFACGEAEHLLIFDAVTTQRPTGPSHQVASISG